MSAPDIGIDRLQRGRPASERAAFTIGGVLRRFAAILRANIGVLAVLSVIVWIIPFVFGLVFSSNASMSVLPTGRLSGTLPRADWLLFAAGGLVSGIVKIVAEGAIVYISTTDGGRRDVVAPLRTGIRYLWVNLAITIVKSLAIGFAAILLVVPGIMLACRWLVAIQAAVAEGAGIGGGLRRSRDLTRGHRWRIFGLILIVLVIAGLLALGQFLLLRAFGASARVILIAFAAATSFITTLITYVGTTAVYLELRDVKEGGTTQEIAAVFE